MQQLWCTEITPWAFSLRASVLCCGDVGTELSLPKEHGSLLGEAAAPNPQSSWGSAPAASTSRSGSTLPLIAQTTQPVAIAGRGAGLPPIPYFIVENNTQEKKNDFPCIKGDLTKKSKNSIFNTFKKIHTPTSTLSFLGFILYVRPLKQEILALTWSKPGLTVMINWF